MPKDNKKNLIALAEKKGNDADLVLFDLIEKLQEELQELKDKKDPSDEEKIEKVSIKLATKLATLEKGEKGDDGKEFKGSDGVDGVDGKEGEDGKDGIDGKDGVDGVDGFNGKDGVNGKDGENGKDGSPDMAEDIRNKLELLSGDERLDAKFIKGLEKIEKDIKNLKQSRNMPSGSVGSQGGHVMVHDLSDSLDGSTKTFLIPAFWRILTIDLSSFPRALRPTIDYTFDSSNMSITFTSEIDVSTSLAEGQTCIITYATDVTA